MADLGKSQANWNSFFRRVGRTYLALLRVFRLLEDQLTGSSVRVRNVLDVSSNFDAVSLSGVDIGVNTDTKGQLYARVTGSGPYTVTLYKDTGGGGGDAVASGSANAGADATLTASNSSGITGTVTLAGSVTVEEDDVHYLSCYVDWPKHVLNVFNSDGTSDKDSLSRNEIEDLLDELAGDVRGQKAKIRASFARFLVRFADSNGTQGYGAEFLLDSSNSLLTNSPDEDGSGSVTRTITGLLVALRQAMEDDSTAGEQDVVKLAVAGTAGTFASSNDGAGTVSSHTPDEQSPAGRHKFICTDATIGRERFSHGFVPSDGGPGYNVSGPIVGQAYTGPLGFGPITIARTLSKTGDGSDLNLDPASAHTVTGENENNTDDGVLHWQIVSNGSNWDISFYSSSNLASGDLVAKATNVATDAAYVASEKNGSGLTVVGVVGSGPTTTTSGTLDLQVFKSQNSNNVSDSFYVDTTVTAGGGEIQTIMTEEFQYPLNSDTSGSESISDDYAKANTYEEFAAAP